MSRQTRTLQHRGRCYHCFSHTKMWQAPNVGNFLCFENLKSLNSSLRHLRVRIIYLIIRSLSSLPVLYPVREVSLRVFRFPSLHDTTYYFLEGHMFIFIKFTCKPAGRKQSLLSIITVINSSITTHHRQLLSVSLFFYSFSCFTTRPEFCTDLTQ